MRGPIALETDARNDNESESVGVHREKRTWIEDVFDEWFDSEVAVLCTHRS